MIATVAFALLAATPCELTWPLWNRYAETFISGDGRVIDRTAGDRTTSEGQAYALFFSLIANDRGLFQRLLTWTEQNLAQGDLARNLPAWHWGKRRNGSWGVIDAKLAVTHYRTIDTVGPSSMLEVTLETGRKNQIRAQLSEAGHPVVGDQMYGAKTNPLGRLGLHAKLLGFNHPTSGKRMTFTASLPKSFRDLMRVAQM